MNNNINDGGPAFARDSHMDKQLGLYVQQHGMSLRDYFAAKAMQAIISSALTEGTKTQYTISKPDFLECLSLDAYAHADAMLKEREPKP